MSPRIIEGDEFSVLQTMPEKSVQTGVVCRKHRREFVGIELNPEYARIARGRLGENVHHDDGRDDAQAVLL